MYRAQYFEIQREFKILIAKLSYGRFEQPLRVHDIHHVTTFTFTITIIIIIIYNYRLLLLLQLALF